MKNLLAKFNYTKEKQLQIFIFFLCIIIYFFAKQYENTMINNGDFWRVCKSMFIETKPWEKLEELYPFRESSIKKSIPISLMGLLGFLIYMLHKLFNLDSYHTHSIFFALSLIYFSGLICLIIQYKINVLQVIILLASYLLFSFYFNSLYEEAIILALGPWLVFSVCNVFYKKNLYSYVIVTCLILIAKAQMLFVLPLVVFSLYKITSVCLTKKKLTIIIFSITILCSFTSILLKGHYFDNQNSYNRIFNGIGWSLQAVSTWPASTLKQRLDYYNQNIEKLTLITKKYEPVAEYNLFGTSFWPMGNNIIGSNNTKLSTDVVNQLSIFKFIQFFINDPSIVKAYIKDIFSITISSNYSLEPYRVSSNTLFQNKFDAITSSLLFYLGAIYILTGFISIFHFKKLNLRIGIAYYFIISPVFVVLGDGYFEFEKHMFPYFMLTPFLILSLLIYQKYLKNNTSLCSYN